MTIDVDEPERVVDRLTEQGIRIRSLPDPEAVRVSVHAFNTDSEIEALVDRLVDCGAVAV